MIKSLRAKPLRIIAIAVLPLALLGTACSSDDDGDDPADTEASSDSPADTEASSDAEESGGNAEVEAFCDQVDEFVPAMEEMIADPTSGDAAALATQAQDLIAAGTALAGSVDSGDADRLEECTQKLSEISN
jgi:hypothetical protein